MIDVRTNAYSNFHPQFNKGPLKYFLNTHGILYRQMQDAFGIIKPESHLLNEEGYLDFIKLARLPQFIEGIEVLIRGIQSGYHIALMCAEKAPSECHRSTLVGRALQDRGYEVHHILHDGLLQTQTQLEAELLECYYPKDHQLALFDQPSEVEQLQRAYVMRNNEIVEINSKRVLKDAYKSPKNR